MVNQNTVRTREEKQVKIILDCHRSKQCLKQTKLSILLYTCAYLSELLSNISIILTLMGEWGNLHHDSLKAQKMHLNTFANSHFFLSLYLYIPFN